LLVVACSPGKLMVGQFGAMVETGMGHLEESGDVDLVEAGLPGQITLLETLLANDPGDQRLRLLLARLYAAQGLLFLEPKVEAALWEIAIPWEAGGRPPTVENLKPQLDRAFRKGSDHALSVLKARRPDSAARLTNVRQIGPYLRTAEAADVPALFWYALNLGAWVNHHLDDLNAVAQAHVAERIMRRVIELAPDYYHGFAHLFLMAHHGSRPPMLGGNPQAARQHYEAYRQISGVSTMLGEVYYGRYCLPFKQDRDGFVSRLKPIAATPIDVDQGLLDAVAIRRSRLYLSAVNRLFEETANSDLMH
jgi:hypothetical protein